MISILIAQSTISFRGAEVDNHGVATLRYYLDIRGCEDSIERAYCFMDALINALEARDIAVTHDEEEVNITRIAEDGETL